MDSEERRASGAHFTHPADIMKIVGPTIRNPWRRTDRKREALKRLGELRERMHNFRVLDPACGSGNFLYIAYRESEALLKPGSSNASANSPTAPNRRQIAMSYLSAQNFYGMDINPFAVELARITMMIARKLASIDELHIAERALPLDNLDDSFPPPLMRLVSTADANTWLRTPWPRADVIIGNPHVHRAQKLLKPQLGPDYVNRVRTLYPEVRRGWPTFASTGFVAHTITYPPALPPILWWGARASSAHQNIRNNQRHALAVSITSCKMALSFEAVENQPWSGEANVHVSIANWAKTQDPALLQKKRAGSGLEVEPSSASEEVTEKGGQIGNEGSDRYEWSS